MPNYDRNHVCSLTKITNKEKTQRKMYQSNSQDTQVKNYKHLPLPLQARSKLLCPWFYLEIIDMWLSYYNENNIYNLLSQRLIGFVPLKMVHKAKMVSAYHCIITRIPVNETIGNKCKWG